MAPTTSSRLAGRGRSLEAAAVGGHVHLVGVLSGQGGEVDPSPVLGKALTVEGVAGVGSRAMFDRTLDAMEAEGTEPVVDRTFGFGEAREAYRYVESGDHLGTVVVRVK